MYREMIGKLIEGHDWAKFQKLCSKKAIEEAKKHVGFTLPRN